jgi:mono/diheme cytochrome c family protein
MMTRKRVVGMVGGLVLAMSGWVSISLGALGDPGKGMAIYEKNCLGCHGPRGDGDSPIGKQLVPPAADLTSATTKKKPDAELVGIIQNGKPKTAMPPFKPALGEQQIRDVLAYVRSLGR